MLVGRNPAIVVDRGSRVTFSGDVYDFYKPDARTEYPTVDGRLSVKCYRKVNLDT